MLNSWCRSLLISWFVLVCTCAQAATLYISDELSVPLRRGPSTGYKILHAGLPSGMALEVISEDQAAGFTQVRTPNGTEGWLETQYLTREPAAKDKLAAATRRAASLEAEMKTLRENFQATRGANAQAESKNADLDKQTRQLQTELAELKRVSATSIAQYEENKQLKIDNQALQTQTTQLTERVKSLEKNMYLRWLMGGGALVLLGLAAGAIIKARPRRSSWA